MKVVISGASGFVGRNVLSLLNKYPNDYEIVSLDITTGFDLTDKTHCDTITDFDVFVHLANLAYVPASYKNPEQFYSLNYTTTLNALELCRKFQAKFIYISSYIYGHPKYLPIDENHPVNPFNPYAQTKVICESMCEGYNRDFKIPIIILRPFNIYGIGQSGNQLISEIIRQVKRGNDIISLKDQFPKRDYINVTDVASGIKTSIDNSDNSSLGIYNLCSGISYSVFEITEILKSLIKSNLQFVFKGSDRPNEVNETKGTYEKIRNELGWKPSVKFVDGLKSIVKHEEL
jgi:UDP-glucose 4-epimerase